MRFRREGFEGLLGFLQGLGLPLEEAMRFWREGFAPRCAGDEFDKKYAYNVRYNYAKEGKRTDYTPYSCLKIISTPVPKARLPPPAACCPANDLIQLYTFEHDLLAYAQGAPVGSCHLLSRQRPPPSACLAV